MKDKPSLSEIAEVGAYAQGAPHTIPIRKGSEASDERVIDLAAGKPLRFNVVSGEQARADGLATAALETQYIRVTLASPVPPNGERRLRIDKTYRDPKTYYREGDVIVFDRSLGIRRNRVTLPAGYELVSCNMPAQVLTDADGRVGISFGNARYGTVGDTLVWRRSFGRPRNAIVLPQGWYLTASSMPATVGLSDDGRVRLDFVNGRPDSLDVLVRAARRSPPR